MTKQEIFDKVWQYYIVEKHKRSIERGVCLYRHPGADGRRCAAGLLIADEHYSPEIEGYAARFPGVSAALKKSGVDMDDADIRDLVGQMQYAHDVSSGDFVDEGLLRRKGVEGGVTVPS